MKQPLSKKFRNAEWEFSRNGEECWHTCLKCNYGWNEIDDGKCCPHCAGRPRKFSTIQIKPPIKQPQMGFDRPYPGYDPNDPALVLLLEIPDFLGVGTKANRIARKLIDASDESEAA